jgi:hypothetical protein
MAKIDISIKASSTPFPDRIDACASNLRVTNTLIFYQIKEIQTIMLDKVKDFMSTTASGIYIDMEHCGEISISL